MLYTILLSELFFKSSLFFVIELPIFVVDSIFSTFDDLLELNFNSEPIFNPF